MPTERTNLDVANIWIGYVFAKLYENFPIPYDFTLSEVVENSGENPPIGEPSDFGFQLIKWLRDEGYVRCEDAPMGPEYLMHGVILTERGLRILNGVPHSLHEQRKVGERLVDASKELGKEAVKKGVGELVGQVIGGIIKSTVS